MEERRLFYVGITRAKDRLFLVYSQNRSAYGYPEPVDPSRFLDDIPYELIEEEQPAVYRRASRSEMAPHDTRWSEAGRTSPKRQIPSQQIYHPGMNVFHPTYGDGMVLNSRLEGDDEVVDVFFADLGMKRLVASLARLEIKT